MIDSNSSLRIIEGVKYRLVQESMIGVHVFSILSSEWGEHEFREEQPEMEKWNWSAQPIKVEDIRLWKALMQDPAFISDLQGRIRVQKERVMRGDAIEPIVIRGRDMVIYDGYARLEALKQLGKNKVLAYLGK